MLDSISSHKSLANLALHICEAIKDAKDLLQTVNLLGPSLTLKHLELNCQNLLVANEYNLMSIMKALKALKNLASLKFYLPNSMNFYSSEAILEPKQLLAANGTTLIFIDKDL